MRYWAFSIILLASPVMASDYGLEFTTGDDYVEVPYDASLNLLYGVTIEAWVKMDNIALSQVIIAKPYATDHSSPYFEWNMWYKGGSGWEFRMASTYWTTGNAISQGVWTHVAFTADGTTWTLYINGTEVNDNTESALPANTNSRPVRMGNNAGSGEEYDGTVDEIRIYNMAQDSATIVAHYNMGMGDCTPDPDSLKGWWMFNTGSGTTAYDSSGLGNDGNLLPEAGEPTWVTGMGLNCDDQTEWRHPTQTAGGTNWTTPDSIFSENNYCASYNATSQDILAPHGFGFSVPVDATIVGIEITLVDGGNPLLASREFDIAITRVASSQTLWGSWKLAQDPGASLSCAVTVATTYGGSSDKWGIGTVTVSDVNDPDFGFLLRDNDTKEGEIYFDGALIKIHYTPAGEAAENISYVRRRKHSVEE